ncbi:RNA polymerase sigma factor [Nitratireductor pacificus]|uniref:ECF subfamily RNA polymerase sigma-70 factor n=1 Tax=Nitratireductor pacificus pht-3B TaxID=391937 RepID=K2ME12_9HYPH|nr:RNA polymerase sigma factor [Nitratireductor pacificus]EKF20411.1 ECF subfamily RNA polymerase sigma-70 factor [Nitratireductor pacificus pht-3B]
MAVTEAERALEAAYRTEKRRVLATLIRLLGGFDAAEEALHEAFAAAAQRWPREGVPQNPYAWLVSAGRFRTIDRWRRETRHAAALPDLLALAEPFDEPAMPEAIADDELRLIFTCCHPALPPDQRIALTLREVGGLTTEEIARAYFATPPTIAQRIVRAKARIRDEAIPYEVPGRADLVERLESVLRVIYLVFSEGYAATGGPALTRADLCAEAIRLARLVAELTGEAEARGLLALMLINEARRPSRTDAAGDLVLLEAQDRTLWNRAMIAEAGEMIGSAFARRGVGPYTLQAAIAAMHAEAPDFAGTDWQAIVSLYDVLLRVDPSPVAALNRAAAIGMRDGPQAGLAAVDAVAAGGGLEAYHLSHAARADFLRRLGRTVEARTAYRKALALVRQDAERRFLERRLSALEDQ